MSVDFRSWRLIERVYTKGKWRYRFEHIDKTYAWYSRQDIRGLGSVEREKSCLKEYSTKLQDPELVKRGLGPGPWTKQRLSFAKTEELPDLMAPYLYDLLILFGAEPLALSWCVGEELADPYLEVRKRGTSILLTIVGHNRQAVQTLSRFRERIGTHMRSSINSSNQSSYTVVVPSQTDLRELVLEMESFNVKIREPYFGFSWLKDKPIPKGEFQLKFGFDKT